MLGRQLKWVKFLSANLPKVGEMEEDEINDEDNEAIVASDDDPVNEDEDEVSNEPKRVKLTNGEVQDDIVTENDNDALLDEMWANVPAIDTISDYDDGDDDTPAVATQFIMLGDTLTIQRHGNYACPIFYSMNLDRVFINVQAEILQRQSLVS